MKRIRLSLLSLALSLTLLTTVMSTSASLVAADDITATFYVASGGEFGITITGNEFTDNDVYLLPGQTVDLSPTVSNDSSMPVYLFAQLYIPSDFSVDGNMTGWTALPSNDDSAVYYFGSGGKLNELSENGTALVFKTVTLSDEVVQPLDGEDPLEYDIVVAVHAIQTQGFDANDPASVWEVAH